MEELKGLIFDADGVIIKMPHFEIWREAVKEYGILNFSVEEYDRLASGFARRDSIRNIFEHFDVSYNDELVESLFRRKAEISQRSIDAGEVEIFRSTLEMILEARESDVKIAVASSSENAEIVLKKYKVKQYADYPSDEPLYDLFDHVISGKVKPGKPNPRIFLIAAQKINARPHECIVFEDAVPGVIAAKKGGMYCVALNRTGIYEELEKQRADIIVEDLSCLSYRELCSRWRDEKIKGSK